METVVKSHSGVPLVRVSHTDHAIYPVATIYGGALSADEADEVADALQRAAGEVRGRQLTKVPPHINTPAAQFMRVVEREQGASA